MARKLLVCCTVLIKTKQKSLRRGRLCDGRVRTRRLRRRGPLRMLAGLLWAAVHAARASAASARRGAMGVSGGAQWDGRGGMRARGRAVRDAPESPRAPVLAAPKRAATRSAFRQARGRDARTGHIRGRWTSGSRATWESRDDHVGGRGSTLHPRLRAAQHRGVRAALCGRRECNDRSEGAHAAPVPHRAASPSRDRAAPELRRPRGGASPMAGDAPGRPLSS